MFNKILIANRGEIALRIIKTLKRMGIGSVAAYSEPDRHLRFVQEADESVPLGGERASESYLLQEKILNAAKKTSADGIHPGYGFLSENAAFAQAVIDSQLKFIGPTPKTISAMGDKGKALEIMSSAGMPTLPRFSVENKTEAQCLQHAESMGYPVLVKAQFGGGGIGMGLVGDAKRLISSISKVQDAAKRNFGKGDVYVEKFLKNAKHIEFQVAGDKNGQIRCLGARECSVQRRHQKIIEETPSPLQIRDPMALHEIQEQILKVLATIGYGNVGTVEMLACEGQFYFLEMNTRLQVEHRITEMVTGHDIVEIQMRIADGQTLDEILGSEKSENFDGGHAIEFRICAEDPVSFLPSPGTIEKYEEPQGDGILVDSGFRAGDVITPYYDSLIAKLVIHGPNRSVALARAYEALTRFHIEGINHNIPFHLNVLSQEQFLSGEYDTKFVESLGGLTK